MIVRHTPVKSVRWGNGSSHRYLTAADGLGYGFNLTTIEAGTRSKLQYRNHIEAVFCTKGSMSVEMKDGTVHTIKAGSLYVLNEHDAHELIGSDFEDCEVVCIFTPGLVGTEVHSLSEDGYSGF